MRTCRQTHTLTLLFGISENVRMLLQLFAKWHQGNVKLKSLAGFLAQEEPPLFLSPGTAPWVLCHTCLESPQATG